MKNEGKGLVERFKIQIPAFSSGSVTEKTIFFPLGEMRGFTTPEKVSARRVGEIGKRTALI